MKRNSKWIAGLLVLLMIFTVLPVQQVEAAKVKVNSVEVVSSLSGSKKTVVVAKGKKVKLSTTVQVKPDKAANKKVTYKSKNSKIAKVDAKGNVQGVKTGKTKIVVTSKKNKKKKATIGVKVTKGAVTNVKLNAKSGKMRVGETVALKATVKAKAGADKTIAWSSSNEKVAVVNANGVVTAVGAGTAKIKASAIDGSGKTATYKVEVTDAVNITGVSVLNSRSIAISLNKAHALTTDMISVMKKTHQNGEYRNQCEIETMTTTDYINYNVVLTEDSSFRLNQFIRVSIPSLNGGVKTMDTVYTEPVYAYTEDAVSACTVGVYTERSFSFYDSIGGVTLSISALPAGLTAENKNSKLVVKGTPTTPGITQGVISGVDEMGNTYTRTVTFIVGSDSVLQAAATPYYDVIGSERLSVYMNISAVGGSDSYRSQVISDPNQIITGCTGVGITASIASPGNYDVAVRVFDANDSNKYCDVIVPFRIAQGITMSGKIKDAQGNDFSMYSDVSITFSNKDKANRYCAYERAYFGEGSYKTVIAPGNYDIEVSYNPGDYDDEASVSARASKYFYNQPLTVSQTGFDVHLPLYKVVLSSAKNADGSDAVNVTRSWYYNHEYVGYGPNIYLKAGNYRLETSEWTEDVSTTTGDWFNGGSVSTIYTNVYGVADVNLTNGGTQAVANLVRNQVPQTRTVAWNGVKFQSDTINLDEWYSIKSPYYSYKYIPAVSGTYKLSIDEPELGLFLFDEKGNKLSSNNSDSYTKYYELEAGKTYYIASGVMESSYEEFKLTLNVDEPSEEE